MRIILEHEDGNMHVEVGDTIALRVKGVETQNGRIVELRTCLVRPQQQITREVRL